MPLKTKKHKVAVPPATHIDEPPKDESLSPGGSSKTSFKVGQLVQVKINSIPPEYRSFVPKGLGTIIDIHEDSANCVIVKAFFHLTLKEHTFLARHLEAVNE